ncbi:MAG: lipocalin family protein [Bacteroidota bacterium]|nr:lipocalin family protein [Bacteroidota bacterium]
MKKKIFAIAVASITLWACNNDDNNKSYNPLLGKWSIENVFVNGHEMDLDSCEKTSYISFTDATIITYDYELNIQNKCVLKDQYTQTYTSSGNTITTEDYIHNIHDINLLPLTENTTHYTIEGNKLIITQENHINTTTSIFVRKLS